MKKLLLFTIILFTLTQLNAQGWGQTQKIVADDRFGGQQFGYAIDIDGDYAVVGMDCVTNDDICGAYVFKNDGNGNWVQSQKLGVPNFNQFDKPGYSVAISGDFIFVGDVGEDYNVAGNNFLYWAGAVYIYEKDGSDNWNYIQKIVASDRAAYNRFGYKISISGNYAIIGVQRQDYDANGENQIDYAGAAYIFERDGSGVWNEVQKLVASDRASDDSFGRSVTISGDYAIVGAYSEDEDENGANTLSSAGSAYIFERDGSGTWNEVQKIVASDRVIGDVFGYSVSMDASYMIVGAYGVDGQGNNSGVAYIFEKNGSGIWNETQKITASDATSGDRFGQSVSIDGDNIIVGAYTKGYTEGNTTYPDGGGAYVFEKDGAGIWNQTQSIYALDRASGDNFGFSVAISGDNAIVGAYQEDEDENEENTMGSAGSAYMFNVNEPSTLSIVETNFGTELNAYPNPTDGDITINLGETYNQIHISVTNILGQEIQTQHLQFSDKITLTLKEKAGIYFINISTDEGSFATIKIIKH